MKQAILFVMIAMLAVSIVSASDSYISEDELSMAYNDVRVVDYCIEGVGGQEDITVVVTDICKDLNSIYGCQAADGDATGLFSVAVTGAPVINDGECTQLTLTTTIANEEDGGNFYYTVNGQVGEATIGTEETGLVQVPEFGVLAAFGILTLAGVFIYRRRH